MHPSQEVWSLAPWYYLTVIESGQTAGPGAGTLHGMPSNSSIHPDSLVEDGAPAAAGARCGAAVAGGDALCDAGRLTGAAAG